MDAATKRCAALLAARGGTMPAATLRREEALKLEDLLHVLRREPHKWVPFRCSSCPVGDNVTCQVGCSCIWLRNVCMWCTASHRSGCLLKCCVCHLNGQVAHGRRRACSCSEGPCSTCGAASCMSGWQVGDCVCGGAVRRQAAYCATATMVLAVVTQRRCCGHKQLLVRT